MVDSEDRSRTARRAAESALVRVAHHYGSRPEFVLIGGLVPELLCASSRYVHAGTTDVDVQVDLEIAAGAVNAARLERALRNAEFEPDGEAVWRWRPVDRQVGVAVKFELLADQDTEPSSMTLRFDGAGELGAVNLRGTRYAAQDYEEHTLRTRAHGEVRVAQINVTGLAGFVLAKCAAARDRRREKDWYDLAFVLLHNDAGGPVAAAAHVRSRFAGALPGLRTAVRELQANFSSPSDQGPVAYANQLVIDHPGEDVATARADAVLAVREFVGALEDAPPRRPV